jgi:hypothetical protein
MPLAWNRDSEGSETVLLVTTKSISFEFQGRLYITAREGDCFIKRRAILFN